MTGIPTMENLTPRKRGPKGKFESKDAQIALLLFLSDSSKSNKDAAAHFKCGVRTIEYALERIRAQSQQKAPTAIGESESDTGEGSDLTTPKSADAGDSVADSAA